MLGIWRIESAKGNYSLDCAPSLLVLIVLQAKTAESVNWLTFLHSRMRYGQSMVPHSFERLGIDEHGGTNGKAGYR